MLTCCVVVCGYAMQCCVVICVYCTVMLCYARVCVLRRVVPYHRMSCGVLCVVIWCVFGILSYAGVLCVVVCCYVAMFDSRLDVAI